MGRRRCERVGESVYNRITENTVHMIYVHVAAAAVAAVVPMFEINVSDPQIHLLLFFSEVCWAWIDEGWIDE